MQSLWQKAPHCLHMISAFTLQAIGLEAPPLPDADVPAGSGGFGSSGTTPVDFSIILPPPPAFDGGMTTFGWRARGGCGRGRILPLESTFCCTGGVAFCVTVLTITVTGWFGLAPPGATLPGRI